LFAGLNDSVARNSRNQMKRLRTRLQANIAARGTGSRIMQKLQWISRQLMDMPNFKLVSV
jgi:hypothetical protein